MLQVDWRNTTRRAVSCHALENHLELILRRLKRRGKVGIELMIVNDREIAKLNKSHRGIGAPTDVLSFPAPSLPANFLGSIVISVDTAGRQAKDAGIKLTDELKMLAGHGLLHLLGYNHK